MFRIAARSKLVSATAARSSQGVVLVPSATPILLQRAAPARRSPTSSSREPRTPIHDSRRDDSRRDGRTIGSPHSLRPGGAREL